MAEMLPETYEPSCIERSPGYCTSAFPWSSFVYALMSTTPSVFLFLGEPMTRIGVEEDHISHKS